jgi:iron(III) transport system substrate-binding protein
VKRLAAITAALCAAALAAACNKTKEADGETASDKPAEVESITIYSGRTEKLVKPVLDAFEKSSGIDVEVKYAGTPELAAALLDEGRSSPADVFIAQDASTLAFLESRDRLAPLPPAIAERVDDTFRSKTWVGVTGRARVLAHSTNLAADKLPESAADLTRPEWKGRVGWAPENASFQSAIAAMIQLEGADATREWLEAMKANGPRDYPKNTPAVLAVSRGEVDVALVNHYYLYRLKAEHGDDFPVANHYLRDKSAHSMVNLSGAAIVAGSKKAAAAEKLLAFLLSNEGQTLFVENNHEFPVASGVDSPDGLPAIHSLGAPALDLSSLRELEETHEILRAAGVLP